MKGLDTNVLIRHLVQDEAAQARLAGRFIASECTREEPGFINRIVLCETVWVLESAYGSSREDIAGVLERVIRTQQFQIENVQSAWTALRMYRSGGADFADCLLGRPTSKPDALKRLPSIRRPRRRAGCVCWRRREPASLCGPFGLLVPARRADPVAFCPPRHC